MFSKAPQQPTAVEFRTQTEQQVGVPEHASDWCTGKLIINGATDGEQSRRLFLSGGAGVDGMLKDDGDASRNERLNPDSYFARQRLVKGDVKTTGRGFFGDPAVGGAITEP